MTGGDDFTSERMYVYIILDVWALFIADLYHLEADRDDETVTSTSSYRPDRRFQCQYAWRRLITNTLFRDTDCIHLPPTDNSEIEIITNGKKLQKSTVFGLHAPAE
jgi:hypothetical protein